MLTFAAIWCAVLSALLAQRFSVVGFDDEDAPLVGMLCGILLAPGVAVMLQNALQ
jgi:hypothetical protein